MVTQTLTLLGLIELCLGWILVFWTITATVHSQIKLRNAHAGKHQHLINGMIKKTIAFGFSLIALAELTTIAALYYPYTYGIMVFALNIPIFILSHQAKMEFHKSEIKDFVEI